MPLNTGKFTKKERIAIDAAVASGDIVEGARRAGYVQPYAAANKLQNRPAVVAEIRKREAERLNNDLLPLAIDRIEKILLDDKESARNHIAAAKLVIDNTIKVGDSSDGKEPHEMTADELANRLAVLRRAQADLAGRAVDVTPTEPDQIDAEPGVFG